MHAVPKNLEMLMMTILMEGTVADRPKHKLCQMVDNL
jgi:hypothetical protein